MLGGHDGGPAPIRYFRYEEIGELVGVLNERIGVDVQMGRSNPSPGIEIDIDTDWMRSLPRLQDQLRFYEAATSA